jgi:hypothetical protein
MVWQVCASNGFRRPAWVGREDLAGDVALQAADDLGPRQAFVRAALGAGAWVVAEAAKNDNIERIVGSTVTAAIEPVSVGASAAGGDTRLPMSILDDVDEIGALYGNSDVMRFIGDGVLAVESVSALMRRPGS